MNRSLSFGLILVCVGGGLLAQESDTKESFQSLAET